MIGMCVAVVRSSCADRGASPRSRPSRASARPSGPRRRRRLPSASSACLAVRARPSLRGRACPAADTATLLVDRVVFREQDSQAADRDVGSLAVGARAAGRRRARRAPLDHRVEQLRLPDRLDQVGGHAQLAARARVARAAGRRQHQDRSSRASRAFARIRSATIEAVHLRHVAVEQHQRERIVPDRSPRWIASSARLAAARPAWAACPSGAASLPGSRRLVALSSTTSTRSPASAGLGALPRRPRSTPRPTRAVKWNVLPLPDSLSTQMLAAHQLDQTGARWPGRARCRRTCAWSSCRPARRPAKISSCLSRGMPMPVSLHREVQQQIAVLDAAPRRRRATTSPALGELDGVADQVDEHLPQPARVADERVGHGSEPRGRPARAPSGGRDSASALTASPERVARGRTSVASSSSLPASILEKSRMSLITPSSESADCLDQLEILALLGRRASVSSTSSVMPMMPFIGVRISWLMLARNSLFAALLSSAFSRAAAAGR